MANVQIHELQQATPTLNDVLPIDTGSVTYKTLVSDVANLILQTYADLSLAGSAQSVKSALDSLGSGKVNKAGDTMTGILNVRTPLTINVPNNDTFGQVTVNDAGGSTPKGNARYNLTSSKWQFIHRKADGTHNDTFSLPETNEYDTANGAYNILTSKEAVSVSQGGTGASTAANARAALAVPYNLGTRITSGGDLDVCIDTGLYVCYASDAPSISNTPYTDDAFFVRVDHFATTATDSNGQIVQTLYPKSGNSIFVRRRSGNSFQSWVKYIGATDGIIPIANGGTGASTAAGATDNLGIHAVQLAGNASEAYTVAANGAFIYAKRGTSYILAVVDYWTADAITIASSGDPLTITHTANSKDVTLENNLSQALFVTIISIRQA